MDQGQEAACVGFSKKRCAAPREDVDVETRRTWVEAKGTKRATRREIYECSTGRRERWGCERDVGQREVEVWCR